MIAKLFVPILIVVLIGVVMFGAVSPPQRTQIDTMITPVQPTPARTYAPGREPIAYPDDYRTALVHYATVDRSDGVTRNIYISPEAVEAARAGRTIPYGSFTVIEAFDSARDLLGRPLTDERGRLVPGMLRTDEIHVGERRSTWYIEDLRANTNFDGWNFRGFEFGTGNPIDRELNECFSCHDSGFNTEFVFTRAELTRYAQTGEVQYRYCPAPDRIVCR